MIDLPPSELRAERIRRERDWYLTDEGFLDFARDCGACPDAEYEPHGRYSLDVITWHGKPDPSNPALVHYKHKLVLWPRGSFKSQLFNVAYCAWRIAKNPDIRIADCSETHQQAAKFVEQIKQIVDSDWYRERFGTHRDEDGWVAAKFTSALRTKKHLKEPTIVGFGVGEVQTGAHWDIVLMDDVVSQKNTRTPNGIESTRTWFGEVKAQLDPGAQLFVLGTLHHFSDLYSWIISTEEVRALFDVSVHAWRDPPGDPDDGVDGELFFPSRLTVDFIREQKLTMPSRLFSCFYNNAPHSSDEQYFKPAYFRVVPDGQIPRVAWTYILTDFGFVYEGLGEGKKNDDPDYTCFWVVSLDPNRVAYVLDVHMGRWMPSDAVRLLCELWSQYTEAGNSMKGVLLETASHTDFVQSLVEEVRRQTFVRPRVILVEGRSQELKWRRIESLEPRFRRGDIYFAESFKMKTKRWRDMLSAMTQWPFTTHDDVPDALSDLDKKTKENRWYCPGPPPGWRPDSVVRTLPQVVDGAANPRYPRPAREMVRSEQPRTSAWPWKSDDQGNAASFWRNRR